MTADATDLTLKQLGGEALLASLAHPVRPGERPEELLLDLGVLDERVFAVELARRSGREFVGLRGFLPDERLFLYVPLAHALVERICPLVLVGSSLKLASAYLDPDLERLERSFPNLRIELVVAPRRDILEALSAVPAGG
jgi:hypothetical protein